MENKKYKVMTILGTRPEIIRLSSVIKQCDKKFEHILVHTGQNYDYELNQIFFEELGLRAPDYYLDCAGKHLGETIGNVIAKSYELIRDLKPDAVLILGDTNSALSAISAKRLKTPIFHMEAGNRCGDWNVPETINRKIVDHIADVNMPYTSFSAKYLELEGIPTKEELITGSPMFEVLNEHKKQIETNDILSKLGLEKGQYIVVSSHREENIDIEKNFFSLMNALNAVADKYKLPIIYSTHPRSAKKIKERGFIFNPLIRNIKPLGLFEYVKLQKCAKFVLSDSGTLTEESAMLHFPGILIRTSTERPEGVAAKSIIVSGIDKKGILKAIEWELENYDKASMPERYDVKDTSKRVVEMIEKYIPIVNKEIWLK